ncbi:MAG: hypothetical protein HZB38_16365 [Planctomycetes bacterium]|nr:hypothetical protein [Planctomycetota bacterium]
MNDVANSAKTKLAGAAPPGEQIAAVRRARDRRFHVCLGILVICALGLQASAAFLGAYFHKDALPLKKQLTALDASELLPRYALAPVQPPPLPHETVDNLGTENYIMLELIDRDAKPSDPTYGINVFLSYFTGKPDMVPHNPEDCMKAGGYDLVNKQYMTIEAPGPSGTPIEIPLAVLDFEPPTGQRAVLSAGLKSSRQTVIFFFCTNGGFATTRSGVRWKVANLFDRYAYYCKIEVSFRNQAGQHAGHQESIDAAGPLLRAVMPLLWKEHFQDWEAVSRGEPPVVAGP